MEQSKNHEKSCIKTDRLLLRPIQDVDESLIFEMRSDSKTMQFIERPLMGRIQEAQALIANILELSNAGLAWYWVIEVLSSRKAIGGITIWNYEKHYRRAEMGFMLHKDFCKNGYMKEAGREVIKFAFNTIKLNSIEAHTRPENLPSQKTLTSLGFNKDGCLRENVFFNDRFWDTIIYTKLHKDKK